MPELPDAARLLEPCEVNLINFFVCKSYKLSFLIILNALLLLSLKIVTALIIFENTFHANGAVLTHVITDLFELWHYFITHVKLNTDFVYA